ncbi:MAG: Oligosaccharide biosynthesis protein Alg14 like protein [Acidimicrobiales bacterium]|nr:Oligosaccharide biosynthesis protein Alg14 like protein [Acidimicrobiales bacterium]
MSDVPPPPRHVLLVCSSGGHLAQLERLRPWWTQDDRTWVTFRKPDATSLLEGERTIWAHHPTTRNVRNLVRNLALAVRVMRRERPSVVVSSGAGVAVAYFVIARAMRIPTVYIEVYDRIDSATLTGRLCRPLASLFCVQWPEQARFYKGSVVIGPLL